MIKSGATLCAITQKSGLDPHESWVALGTYMDALDEHLDGAYLKLQVALETLSHVVPGPDRAPLVAEPRKWDAWVTAHAEEIRAFGRDHVAAKKLVNKVRSAQNAPATDVVED